MADTPPRRLDFSTGSEPRIEVRWEGWSGEHKQLFRERVEVLPGVVGTRTAGGSTSLYVNFNPDIIDGEHLEGELTKLRPIAEGTLSEDAKSDAPARWGEAKWGKAEWEQDATALHPTDYLNDRHLRPPERGPILPSSPPLPSTEWTGLVTSAQRAKAIQSLLPSARDAVRALLFDLEQAGGNNGPPLGDREEASATLRQLHNAIGELLKLADMNDLEGVYGLGLIGEIRDCALRVRDAFKHNPVQSSVVVMTAAIAVFFSGPAAALAAGIGAAAGLAEARKN